MQNLISYGPPTDTGLDELFRGFFKPVRLEGAPTPITIKMDAIETENGYLVHSELPGVKKEDIDVAIEGNQVTITAEVKREWEKKRWRPPTPQRAVFRQRLSQLHAAGGAGRGGV